MGLFTTAAAFGAGYTLGHPGGRARARTYLEKARQWAKRPEVTRARERGWDLAGAHLASVKNQLGARTGATATAAPSDSAARDARRQPARGWRRGLTVAPTVTGAPAEVGPNVVAAPTDPLSGFDGTTVAEDSQAVVSGHATLPPTDSPGSPGSTPTSS